MTDVSRRTFAAGLVAAGISAGCAARGLKYVPKSGDSASLTNCFEPSSASGPLLIDIHCHIFTSVDVPIRNWTAHLLRRDAGIRGQLWGAIARVVAGRVSARDEAKAPFWNGGAAGVCEAYKVKGSGRNGFIGRMSEPRVFNAIRLLDTYSGVHLFTPAIVDLYTGMGAARESTRGDLLKVYERIILMARGRLHPFIGYDPLRDVHIGDTRFLDTVRQSVETGGFVGVKLYPQMGFAPIGNDWRACGNSVKYQPPGVDWRHLAAQSGAAVDARLNDLYQWASKNHVPIMAHCNDSNYARAECASGDRKVQEETDLGSPQQWSEVLEKYPDLRLNLSHFGGPFERVDSSGRRTDDDNGTIVLSPWAKEITRLIEKYPNVYADLGYTEELLPGPHAEDFAAALHETMTKNPKLARHVMYGSDWFMLVNQKQYERYIEAVRRAVPPSAADAVFGENAVRFLGLHRDSNAGNTRARLEAYYQRMGLPVPAWQGVVDQLPG